MKNIIQLIIFVAVAIGALIYGAKLFSPGRYVDSEHFTLQAPLAKVLEAAEALKKTDSTLVVPQGAALIDGKRNENDPTYYVYYHFREDDQVVLAWIRQFEANETTVALVSVRQGPGLGHWQDVNRDFASDENERQIECFKNRVIEPIRATLNFDK